MPLARRIALPLALFALLLASSAGAADTCNPTFTSRFANAIDPGCSATVLVVTPNPVDPGSPVTLNGTGSVGPGGLAGDITSYAWDFGDGTPTDETASASIQHTYTQRNFYDATLTTKSGPDSLKSATVRVYVCAAPAAVLGVPGGVLTPGHSYDFSAAGSSSAGGSIAQYVWNWGDGGTPQTTAVPSASHTFAANGASTGVTLTVVNDLGLASTPATQAITVHNQLPLIQLVATPSTVAVGQQLTLDATGSSDPDGTIVEYRWDLDENGSFETSTGTNPQVTAGGYPNPGVLHLRVEAIDDSGGASIASVPVTVLDPNPPVGGGGTGGGTGGSGGSTGGQAGGGSGGGAGGSSGGGGPTGSAADAFALGLSGTAIQRLTAALRHGVALRAQANRPATGTLTLSVSAGDARKLQLARRPRKPVTIGTLRLTLRAGRLAKPSIKLTRAATRALRHAHPRTLRVTIRGSLAAGAAHTTAVRVVLLRG